MKLRDILQKLGGGQRLISVAEDASVRVDTANALERTLEMSEGGRKMLDNDDFRVDKQGIHRSDGKRVFTKWETATEEMQKAAAAGDKLA